MRAIWKKRKVAFLLLFILAAGSDKEAAYAPVPVSNTAFGNQNC